MPIKQINTIERRRKKEIHPLLSNCREMEEEKYARNREDRVVTIQ
jgi:hypothetical protein